MDHIVHFFEMLTIYFWLTILEFYPKLKTLPLHGLLKYAGDINAIAKRFIETGEHSSETELQAYVLAKLSEFGVECFPKEYKRLTMDDYSFKFGEADFYQKTDRIEAAIYNFQHPQQMVNNLHLNDFITL